MKKAKINVTSQYRPISPRHSISPGGPTQKPTDFMSQIHSLK